jgi:hypothetical protein
MLPNAQAVVLKSYRLASIVWNAMSFSGLLFTNRSAPFTTPARVLNFTTYFMQLTYTYADIVYYDVECSEAATAVGARAASFSVLVDCSCACGGANASLGATLNARSSCRCYTWRSRLLDGNTNRQANNQAVTCAFSLTCMRPTASLSYDVERLSLTNRTTTRALRCRSPPHQLMSACALFYYDMLDESVQSREQRRSRFDNLTLVEVDRTIWNASAAVAALLMQTNNGKEPIVGNLTTRADRADEGDYETCSMPARLSNLSTRLQNGATGAMLTAVCLSQRCRRLEAAPCVNVRYGFLDRDGWPIYGTNASFSCAFDDQDVCLARSLHSSVACLESGEWSAPEPAFACPQINTAQCKPHCITVQTNSCWIRRHRTPAEQIDCQILERLQLASVIYSRSRAASLASIENATAREVESLTRRFRISIQLSGNFGRLSIALLCCFYGLFVLNDLAKLAFFTCRRLIFNANSKVKVEPIKRYQQSGVIF